jgi:hypothetical protein
MRLVCVVLPSEKVVEPFKCRKGVSPARAETKWLLRRHGEEGEGENNVRVSGLPLLQMKKRAAETSCLGSYFADALASQACRCLVQESRPLVVPASSNQNSIGREKGVARYRKNKCGRTPGEAATWQYIIRTTTC